MAGEVCGGVRLRVVLDEGVPEDRLARFRNAVDVAMGPSGVARVDGGKLCAVRVWGAEDCLRSSLRLLTRVRCCDCRKAVATQVRTCAITFLTNVLSGGRGIAEHIGEVETRQTVEVVVHCEISNDVCCAIVGQGRFLPSVDGVEAEERVAVIGRDDTGVPAAIDHVPFGGLVGVEFEGVYDVAVPEDFDAPGSEVRVPNAKDHVILGQEERVKVCRSCIRDGGQDVGLSSGGRDSKDTIRWFAAELEVVVEDVSCVRVRLRMRRRPRSLQVWMKRALAGDAEWLQSLRIEHLEAVEVSFASQRGDSGGMTPDSSLLVSEFRKAGVIDRQRDGEIRVVDGHFTASGPESREGFLEEAFARIILAPKSHAISLSSPASLFDKGVACASSIVEDPDSAIGFCRGFDLEAMNAGKAVEPVMAFVDCSFLCLDVGVTPASAIECTCGPGGDITSDLQRDWSLLFAHHIAHELW